MKGGSFDFLATAAVVRFSSSKNEQMLKQRYINYYFVIIRF